MGHFLQAWDIQLNLHTRQTQLSRVLHPCCSIALFSAMEMVLELCLIESAYNLHIRVVFGRACNVNVLLRFLIVEVHRKPLSVTFFPFVA